MSLASGSQLAHYRLVEKIGEGGMGVVWKAFDTHLEREVAIKLLPEDLGAEPQRLESFRREAKTVAALSHPNIVTIYEIEEIQGRHFLVMELVHGRTLDRVIPEHGLPLSQFLQLAVAIADAVGAVHELGIIHRDLKPGNIIVRDDGRPTVLDFGVAKAAPAVAGDQDTLSTSRTLPARDRVQGTIPYMSPEQLQGQPLDRRSDLFSLGVIFHEMVTGRRPFSGASVFELIAAILRDEPRTVSELRPGLPRQLGRILRHALEKQPQRRFQTAIDLRNELEALQEEIVRGPTATDVRAVAVLPLDDLSGDPAQAFFADGMTDVLINSLARIGALKVISRTSVMRYKGRQKPLHEIALDLGVDAIVEGSVLRAGERVRITAQLIDAARDRLLWAESYEENLGDVLEMQNRVAHAIAARIEVELTPQEHAHLTRAAPVDPDVHEACLKGRHFWYKRTAESVRQGLAYFEKAVQLDPTYAPAHAGIADSYIVDGGRYLGVAPDVAYTRARAAALRAMSLDERLAEAHTSLAAVMADYDWDWDGADREYRRAIELNPNYVTAHSWYAEHLSRMGRHDEAVAAAKHARDLDPLSLVSSMIVAWILYFARRFQESIEWGQRTLELDADYATAHRILGWAYEESGRFDAAIAAHRRASALAHCQPNFAGQLGRAYALAGRREDARAVLDELLQRARETYVSALDIAVIHTALGDHDLAFVWLERAYAERADHLPYLKVNPRFDALRADARFAALLQRLRLAD